MTVLYENYQLPEPWVITTLDEGRGERLGTITTLPRVHEGRNSDGSTFPLAELPEDTPKYVYLSCGNRVGYYSGHPVQLRDGMLLKDVIETPEEKARKAEFTKLLYEIKTAAHKALKGEEDYEVVDAKVEHILNSPAALKLKRDHGCTDDELREDIEQEL